MLSAREKMAKAMTFESESEYCCLCHICFLDLGEVDTYIWDNCCLNVHKICGYNVIVVMNIYTFLVEYEACSQTHLLIGGARGNGFDLEQVGCSLVFFFFN